MVCYGAGLRICEAVAVKVKDIDASRMLLRVENGNGGKDRYTTVPATTQRFAALLEHHAYSNTHQQRTGNSRRAVPVPLLDRRKAPDGWGSQYRLPRGLVALWISKESHRPHPPPLFRGPDYAG